MIISRQTAARKLTAYLHHRLSLDELVAWAEVAMMEADFDDGDFDLLRDIISRLGLADVRTFGLAWEDAEDYLQRLGYVVNVTVTGRQEMDQAFALIAEDTAYLELNKQIAEEYAASDWEALMISEDGGVSGEA